MKYIAVGTITTTSTASGNTRDEAVNALRLSNLGIQNIHVEESPDDPDEPVESWDFIGLCESCEKLIFEESDAFHTEDYLFCVPCSKAILKHQEESK